MSSPTSDLVSRLRAIYSETNGETFATSLVALFAEESWATAFDGSDNRWYGPRKILEQWLLPETETHRDYRRDLGPVWVSGTNVLIFSKVSCSVGSGPDAEWLALDVFQTSDGRIVSARFGNDTIARQSLDRQIDATGMWAAIEASWSPVTTAANRVGMKFVTDQKSAPGTAEERYRPIMERQTDDCQMWSWEVDGLLHLADREAVDRDFWEPLFPLIPDFVEAVEQPLIFGNALLLVQNPAGTFTNAHGQHTFSAWYNLDIYVFEGDRVNRLFFARDTFKDETQMLAAFDGAPPPDLPGSIHLAPFASADE
ncbi:hypothetical protein [Streptomyces sp. NPDC004250]|uniref:hypothetical protein n=1 Tax=Streptomyces sp. NPDC004250 TaxID=3364692 RepID=UPI0036A7AEF7